MDDSITVAIPTYNRPASVKHMLAILAPQVGPDDEVLIIDDGNERLGDEWLLEWGDIPIRYVRHEINWGMVPTWNDCLRLASKEWICIIHDDDDVSKDAIALLKRAISSIGCPAVIASSPRAGDINPAFRYTYSDSGSWAVLNAPTTPSGVTLHRELVNRLGMFNEAFHYSSDLEYFPRLLRHFPMLIIESAQVVRYQLHDTNHQYVTWQKRDFLSQLLDIERAVLCYSGLDAASCEIIRARRWRAYLVHMFYSAGRIRSKSLLTISARALARSGRLDWKLRLKVWAALYLRLNLRLRSLYERAGSE